MWKSLKDLPTLTELFFGKGVDPATYGRVDDTLHTCRAKVRLSQKQKQ
jgi:hypothetical protein